MTTERAMCYKGNGIWPRHTWTVSGPCGVCGKSYPKQTLREQSASKAPAGEYGQPNSCQPDAVQPLEN